MSDQHNDALIAIYDDVTVADLNFDTLVEFESNVPFDAVVAAKSASGEVEIQRTHRAHRSSKERRDLEAGLAAGLFADDGAAEGEHSLTVDGDRRKQLLEVADAALDNGEALVCLVCDAEETGRFDRLLTNARRVLPVDLTRPAGG
jgi:hypothetical protein